MKSDVVVIGGGMAGLAAGALLAKRGYKTVVLEKGNQPGGRAYTYADKGFVLNYGPHAMYLPHSGIHGDIVRELGRPPVPCGWPDPLKSFWADGDRLGSLGSKPHQLLATKLFPLRSKLRLGAIMLAFRSAKVDQLDESLTYGEWVDSKTRDPLLRRFLRALGTVNTYSRPVSALSARFLVGHMQKTLFAKDYVGYMSGGWATSLELFIDALREHSGELVTGAAVESLETDGSTVAAAIAGGARFEAQAFVLTLPPQDAHTVAGAGTPLAAELARWGGAADVRALCMDLGFSRRLRTDATFFFDVERDLYYSLHSEVTPDLAPEGQQLCHAMAYLSPEEAASEALRAQRKLELEAGLDRFLPGWREARVVERVLPNVGVASMRRTPDQFGQHALPLRPASASNVFIANDARDLPGDLAQCSLQAAKEAADAIAATYTPGVGASVSAAAAREAATVR